MDRLDELYFRWLTGQVCDDILLDRYNKLLKHLYSREFIWIDPMDENTAINSVQMRGDFYDDSPAGRRYADIYGDIEGPCNVLELMVYLATSAEQTYMSNSYYGDRTYKWFWLMIESLHLKSMDNSHYNEDKIDEIIDNLIDKNYAKNGDGSLFRFKNRGKFDASNIPIWRQMNIFLSEFADEDGEI